MASGKAHTAAGLLVAAVIGAVGSLQPDMRILAASAGTAFAAYMCSPDMDTYSLPFARWGLLRFVWSPYKRLVPHRSFWSHTPIIGTSLRVVYLLGLYYLLACFFIDLQVAANYVLNEHLPLACSFIIGMCIADFVHWLQDGCPL